MNKKINEEKKKKNHYLCSNKVNHKIKKLEDEKKKNLFLIEKLKSDINEMKLSILNNNLTSKKCL